MAPKDVHVLIPGTSKCSLCVKRDFENVIKLNILRWGIILIIWVGPVITGVLVRERQREI